MPSTTSTTPLPRRLTLDEAEALVKRLRQKAMKPGVPAKLRAEGLRRAANLDRLNLRRRLKGTAASG